MVYSTLRTTKVVFPIKQYHGILGAMLKMAGKFVRGKCDTAKKIPSQCYFDHNMTVLENHNTVDTPTIVPVNA